MMQRIRPLMVGLTLLASAACNRPEKEVVPIEELVLKPRTTRDAFEAVKTPKNAYVTVVAEQTVGLLPGSLAVARVDPTDPGPDAPNVVGAMNMSPNNEMIDFMNLFDDTWVVSEVFPVTYPIRPARRTTPAEIVACARDDGASICLIYSVDRRSDEISERTEVRGALYDARNGNLLGRMQADARVLTLEEDQLPPPPPEDRADADLRHVDSWFIAQERFREHVRNCVIELIGQDEQVGPRAGSHWHTSYDGPRSLPGGP